MDDFTQFQLKEYENISQAHFKTNEVLATFYRYYLLITAIPITTIGLALLRLSEGNILDESRIIAYYTFGISTVILSIVGAAVVTYIEGLRLDAILYARVVNSIRDYFFKLNTSNKFGPPILPRDSTKPTYGGFGASLIMFYACAVMNAAYFACGVLALNANKELPLMSLEISKGQWGILIVAFLFLLVAQGVTRCSLINNKHKMGI